MKYKTVAWKSADKIFKEYERVEGDGFVTEDFKQEWLETLRADLYRQARKYNETFKDQIWLQEGYE